MPLCPGPLLGAAWGRKEEGGCKGRQLTGRVCPQPQGWAQSFFSTGQAPPSGPACLHHTVGSCVSGRCPGRSHFQAQQGACPCVGKGLLLGGPLWSI